MRRRHGGVLGRSLEWVDHDLGCRSVRGVQAVRLGGQPVHHRVPLLRAPPAPARPEAAPRARAPSSLARPRAPARAAAPIALARARGARAPPRRRSYASRWASPRPYVDDRARGGQLRGVGRLARRTRAVPEHGDRRAAARRLVEAVDQRVRLRQRPVCVRRDRHHRAVRLAARAPPRPRRGARAVRSAAGATGALVAERGVRLPVSWAAATAPRSRCWRRGPLPTCARRARGDYYEGDLLGAGAIAALLLALPFALVPDEASWLAGVTGGAFGLLIGLGLAARRPSSSPERDL